MGEEGESEGTDREVGSGVGGEGGGELCGVAMREGSGNRKGCWCVE